MSNKAEWRTLLREIAGDAAPEVFTESTSATASHPMPTAAFTVVDSLTDLRSGVAPRTTGGGAFTSSVVPTYGDFYREQSRIIAEHMTVPLSGGDPVSARVCVMVYDKHPPLLPKRDHHRLETLDELVSLLAAERANAKRKPHAQPLASTAHYALGDDDNDDATPAVQSKTELSLLRKIEAARANVEHLERVRAEPDAHEHPAATALLPWLCWEYLMHCRELRRPMVIRAVVRALLSPPSAYRVAVERMPPLSMLVVDGHHMSLAQARSAFGTALIDDGTYAGDHRDVPLVAMLAPSSPSSSGVNVVVTYAYALRNSIGEADLSMFWHAYTQSRVATDSQQQQLQQRVPRIVVSSIDSDALLLAMLFVAQCDRDAAAVASSSHASGGGPAALTPQVYVSYMTSAGPAGMRRVVFHANAMCRVVRAHPAFAANPTHAVESCVALLLMGGADYVESYYFVPHKHFVTAALRSTYAAQLVVSTPAARIDATTHTRLAHLAYSVAHDRSMRKAPFGSLTSAEIVANLRALLPRKRVPGDVELANRCAHVDIMLTMWTRMRDADLAIPDPCTRGYERVDGVLRRVLAPRGTGDGDDTDEDIDISDPDADDARKKRART